MRLNSIVACCNQEAISGRTVTSACNAINKLHWQFERPPAFTIEEQEQLLTHATASQANHHKCLSTIANELGIQISNRTLHCLFCHQGYHHRIARTKPFLTKKSKKAYLTFANQYWDWAATDWCKVIWKNECAFNVGGSSGRTWVTQKMREEFLEDCLRPKFSKLETIMIWGCIYGKRKGPLII